MAPEVIGAPLAPVFYVQTARHAEMNEQIVAVFERKINLFAASFGGDDLLAARPFDEFGNGRRREMRGFSKRFEEGLSDDVRLDLRAHRFGFGKFRHPFWISKARDAFHFRIHHRDAEAQRFSFSLCLCVSVVSYCVSRKDKLPFMNDVVLSSRSHPLLRIGRALCESKGRREHGLFLIEGRNAVEAALRHNWPMREVFALENETELSERAQGQGLNVRRASREWMAAMSDSLSAPPILAWGEIPLPIPFPVLPNGLIVVLDGIADPGNVGTIWRAADALGAARILVTQGTADVWNPKVVRGAAGSLFALPPVSLDDSSPTHIARALREQGFEIVRADAHGAVSLSEFVWPTRAALVLGHETRGVSGEFVGHSVTIPFRGSAESLNVAMAATIFLWQHSLSVE